MTVNWDMARQPDFIGNALLGFQQGQQMRQQKEARNALSTLIQNPNDTAAFGQLAEANPELALKYRGQRVDQQGAQLKQQQTQMVQLGRLLDYAKDETTYQQARQAAQQIGIDVSKAPANFDPTWVQQQQLVVRAFQDPKTQEALSNYGKIAIDRGLQPGTPQFAEFVTQAWQADQVKTIPYTQGGGVAGFNPATGSISTIVAPNPGGYAAGTPVQGGGVQEGATATNPQTGEKIQFRGGQWVPMGGGSGGNVGGGFRP